MKPGDIHPQSTEEIFCRFPCSNYSPSSGLLLVSRPQYHVRRCLQIRLASVPQDGGHCTGVLVVVRSKVMWESQLSGSLSSLPPGVSAKPVSL
ncbi:hypothetical protein GDO81_016343 [Engystomops pustulosus]|uniref:Uncharacterized protein n=1 Tax=Engystomops pustulosus TaxID=76066 RepID=A0AAV7ARE5_ENGPU|nr:hypothetical protein GDO81_016343 [Engystomops pustulosus]